MIKIRTLLSIGAIALASSMAWAGANLTLGTYNVRLRTLTDKTDDPATNKYWDARADYVARTIRDCGFQVVALNELTDDDRLDGHTMMQDMYRNFRAPEWAFVEASSRDVRNLGTIHCVLYKTDVVEELEHGSFWHSPTPETFSDDVYDFGNKARMSLWVKFRVKETGEIFYFFETHLHHQGNMGRNEGARLNVEYARKLSGGYPVFIAGDHNSYESRFPMYDLCSAYFMDSRKNAEKVIGPEGTCNVWTTSANTRLDHVWVRGAKIHSYTAFEEKYDLGFYPSDHLPVVLNVTLEDPLENRVKYVAESASEGGDGSISAPFANLQDALDSCVKGDTIRVTEGTYYPTYSTGGKFPQSYFNVSKSVTIQGGYNDTFTAVTGKSVFSGDLNGNGITDEGDATHVFAVAKTEAFELSDAEVCHGYSKGTNGAGILCEGPRVILDRVTVRDNMSRAFGGGVYAYAQLIARNCTFERNETTGTGGGVYVNYNNGKIWWFHHISDCVFRDNKALGGSAAYITGSLWVNVMGNTFDGNVSTARGTLTIGGDKISTPVTICNNTFVNNKVEITNNTNAVGGSAILILDMKTDGGTDSPAATVAIINNTIVNNECLYAEGVGPATGFRGAAVQTTNVMQLYLNHNIIAGNYSVGPNADVYIQQPDALVKGQSRYNLFTSAQSISYSKEYYDLQGTDAASTAAELASVLDGTVIDGRFYPNLAQNGGATPTVRLVNPTFAGKPVNCIKKTNLAEDKVVADLNADRQIQKALLDVDQRGVARSLTNSACIGAYEWSVDDPAAGMKSAVIGDTDAPAVYYNLQGMRVENPTPGIYIVRKGHSTAKVMIQ
ncbi:MAG: hypothetical protein HDS65_02590 [Bacteroidales bacterium]|nr:hypothetical protein [Bacteroidales bacterium]